MRAGEPIPKAPSTRLGEKLRLALLTPRRRRPATHNSKTRRRRRKSGRRRRRRRRGQQGRHRADEVSIPQYGRTASCRELLLVIGRTARRRAAE